MMEGKCEALLREFINGFIPGEDGETQMGLFPCCIEEWGFDLQDWLRRAAKELKMEVKQFEGK